MGWIRILVCDGCFERIEPEPSGRVSSTDTACDQDAIHYAKSRKWTKSGKRKDRKYYCPTCTRILRDKGIPEAKPTAGRSTGLD
jgi:hypothetical protein